MSKRVRRFWLTAYGTNRGGVELPFMLYSVGDSFEIVTKDGIRHHAHPSRRLNEEDARLELIVVFDLEHVRLERAS